MINTSIKSAIRNPKSEMGVEAKAEAKPEMKKD